MLHARWQDKICNSKVLGAQQPSRESKHSLWQHSYVSLVMYLEQKTSGCWSWKKEHTAEDRKRPYFKDTSKHCMLEQWESNASSWESAIPYRHDSTAAGTGASQYWDKERLWTAPPGIDFDFFWTHVYIMSKTTTCSRVLRARHDAVSSFSLDYDEHQHNQRGTPTPPTKATTRHQWEKEKQQHLLIWTG